MKKELELKKYTLVIKRNGVVVEQRILEAYGRDYARRWADQMEIQENCTITVKNYKDGN